MAYNLLPAVHVITSGDMSTNITSQVLEIKNQDNIGIQLHWTGSPVGTFDVQISSNHLVDIFGSVQVVGNWVSLPLNPAITATGSADDAYIDLNQMSAQYIKVVYTASSGTGTLDAYIVAKGV
jgi:hypothetical protein